MQTPPKKASQVIFQQALIFGLSLFGLRLLITVLDFFTRMTSSFYHMLSRQTDLSMEMISFIGASVYTLLYVIAALVLFFLAGMFAAQRTGKMGSGVLAGLWGGLIYSGLSLVLFLIIFFGFTVPIYNRYPHEVGLLISPIITFIITAVLITGLGACSLGGVLGGIVGQGQARRRGIFPPLPAYMQPHYQQPAYQQAAYAPPIQGVQCKQCSHLNQPGDQFCARCGKSLLPEKKLCTQCGAEIRPDATFCTSCGASAQPQPVQQGEAQLES